MELLQKGAFATGEALGAAAQSFASVVSTAWTKAKPVADVTANVWKESVGDSLKQVRRFVSCSAIIPACSVAVQ